MKNYFLPIKLTKENYGWRCNDTNIDWDNGGFLLLILR